MDRIMITMPAGLRQALDRAAAGATENRSEFVRRAVQERIERLQQQRFERSLAAAYRSGEHDPASNVADTLAAQDAAAGEDWVWDD